MTEFAHDTHPSPETLAAFVEGKVRGTELVRLSDHLRECRECRQIAGETSRFLEEQPASSERPALRWWWIAAAAAVAGVAVLVLLPRFTDPLDRLHPNGYRPYQTRLAVFDHAPYRALRSSETQTDYEKLAAAAKLQRELQQERTAESLHRFALAQMALGKSAEAVELLSEATRLRSDDARLLSDLAAAQIASGDVVQGTENAGKAAERDPQSRAAAFNWALGLELLSNRPAAIEAWERYLQLDRESAWAAEARQHLARLRTSGANWGRDRERLNKPIDDGALQQLVERYPQRMRDFILDELLPRWCAARREEDFQLARRAAAFRAATGDPMLFDIVRPLQQVSEDEARAFRAYHSAVQLLRSRDLERIDQELRRAADALARVDSPLAHMTELYAATNDCYRGRYEDSLQRLMAIERRVGDRDRYPALAGEIEWVRGLVLSTTGRSSEALEAYRRAERLAAQARETEDEIALSSLISGLLDQIGDPDEARRFRESVLRRVDAIGGGDRQRAYVTYIQSTVAALHERRPRVALAFNAVHSQIAAAEKEPLYVAESAMTRALAYRELGRLQQTFETLRAARREAAAIRMPVLRDRVTLDIDFIEGTTHGLNDPRRAIENLSSALAISEKHRWRRRSAAARLSRGEAYLRAGDAVRAEADWRAGIEEMEQQRASFGEPSLRLSYFERADRLFERLIEHLAANGRAGEALEIAERKRARLLLDNLAGQSGGRPLTAAEITSAVPPSSVLVAYLSLPGELLIWSVRDGALRIHRHAVSRDEIERRVTARDWTAMRSMLIDPVWNDLRGASSIIFVPDGALFGVPFGALPTADGDLLLERAPVSTAPSASVFIRGSALRTRAGEMLAVLSRGDDAPDLPHSAREVQQLMDLYPRMRLLRDEGASEEEFARLAAAASVIHYSGHAIADLRQPSQSALLLSGSESLRAGEIAAMRLSGAPLVVLAACSTGRGTAWRNEGANTLAAAFLHAGARAVVATLWDIEDRAAAQLFGRFHENLRGGDTPAQALQKAQLSMLRSSDPSDRDPAAWAGAVLIGAV